jgi:hypothetical protein
MPLPLALTVAPAAAGGSTLTDSLSAVGTVVLALAAVVILMVTMKSSKAERRREEKSYAEDRRQAERGIAAERTRAEQERADADRRLREEREAADQRLRDEREYAERVRRHEREHAEQIRLHDRRVVAVAGLLERIARAQMHFSVMPGLSTGASTSSYRADQRDVPVTGESRQEALDAIFALQHGCWTEAAMLGAPGGVDQYRKLVHLVVSAAEGVVPSQYRERVSIDLNRYAAFVRCSLRSLVDSGKILDPGYPPYPALTREASEAPWSPQYGPPGYWEEIQQTDPYDPQYRPAK